MKPPENPQDEDVWDYLEKHTGYPKRADRDDLLAAAKKDPGKMRRVEVWDFFFPLNRDLIIGPLQAKIKKCYAEISRIEEGLKRQERVTREGIANCHEAIERAKAEWERRLPELRAQFARDLEAKGSSRRSAGKVSLGIAVALGLMGLIVGGSIDEGFGVGCGLFLAAVPGIIGLILLTSAANLQTSQLAELEARERQRIADYIRDVERQASELGASLEEQRKADAAALEELRRSIRDCEARIVVLERQIPAGPSAAKVCTWFKKELSEIRKELLRESGQEGRLIKARSGRDKFTIIGPAELQERDQIEKPYLEEDSDWNSHLHAKRVGVDHAGNHVALYGVWLIEFLFLGQDELTSYRVFYDFISKRKATRSRIHNYNAVALIEMRSQFRKIKIMRGGTLGDEVVDDVPSLYFALENGERIEINFPNESYFAKAVPGFDASEQIKALKDVATGACKNLRENVHRARTRPAQDPGKSQDMGLLE